jgi:AmmeMemoRadiSam system protein A
MHPLVEFAKKAIAAYVKDGVVIPPPEEPAAEMKEKAGVFVSLKKHGQLRGCIGTFMPVEENVALEVVNNAISAATRDPRFAPVAPGELDEITYSVDLLSMPEKVADAAQLDPKNYGVIVVKGGRKGLLLPDLEGVNTVNEQLSITKMKAGIDSQDDDVEIFRFRVRRFH